MVGRTMGWMFIVGALSLAGFRCGYAQEEGLAGYWPFDEGFGVTAHDKSGKGNNGKISGAQYVREGMGHALQCDGKNNYVNIDTAVSSVARSAIGALEAWIYFGGSDNSNATIMSFGNASAHTFVYLSIANGKLCGHLANSGTHQWIVNTNSNLDGHNKWIHVALVQDGKEPVLYVNGIKQAATFDLLHSPDKTQWLSSMSVDNARIGCVDKGNQGNTVFFHGIIDEVKIYSRVLSDEEIKKHYEDTKSYFVAATGKQAAAKEQSEQTTDKTGAGAAKAILAAHWRFDEGKGEILHDSSGNGNDGTIKGAKWVKNGEGYALEFDGAQDCVDCGAGPSLDIRDRISVTAWVWVKEREAVGDAGIVGKDYESYVITLPYAYRSESRITTYLSGGGGSTHATLAPGQWHHVASTYDGRTLRLYIDGRQARVKEQEAAAIKSGNHFWMGRSDGAIVWTKDAHFAGKISEVRVYRGALAAEEVAELARTTNITHEVNLSVLPLPWRGELLVELNTLGLGPVEGGVRVGLAVYKRSVQGTAGGARQVLLERSVQSDGVGGISVGLDVHKLAAGDYEVEAVAKTARNKQVGQAATVAFTWDGMPEFPRGPAGARRLNNLVTELLNVSGPDASGKEYSFANPRLGWIFISNAGTDTVALRAAKDNQPAQVALADAYGDAHEAMRYLPPGSYTVSTGNARNLIVRAIPQLFYIYMHPNGPQCSEYLRFDLDQFQQKYILGSANSCLGWQDSWTDKPFADPWIARGKKWFVNCPVPKGTKEKPLTEEDVYSVLVPNAHWLNPKVSGFFADEFEHSAPYDTVWAKALDKLLSDPKTTKSFNPFVNNIWNGEEGRELASVIVKHNGTLAWKCYMIEQRTEPTDWRVLISEMVYPVTQFRDKCPGSIPRLTACIGYFVSPQISLDTFPDVNFRTHLDMQFQLMATHPVFEGLGGLMTYSSGYSEEETVRLGAKLFRHYGIEGRTDPFSREPYILPYLKNADFETGGDGWTLSPAEEDASSGKGSIRFDTSLAFGYLAGRWPAPDQGDAVIVTRRCANKPNVFSQEIRNLEPGRLYSFRMFSGNFKDLFEKEKHAISIKIDKVAILPEKSFTHVYPNLYTQYYGKYRDAEHQAWINYHWLVFKAQGKTATLAISDWADDKTPGGKIGQELMFNFVQVQPYLEE